MGIVETNLTFTSDLLRRKSTRRAIIHHSASGDVTAATIHGWHLKKGWAGIGYQFVIRQDGTIERGRPIWSVGAHSGSKGNVDSIGIVLTGNFETGSPSPEQMDSLAWLIKDHLKPRYGNIDIIGHSDVMATACPGRNFPWAELKKRLEEKPMPEDWKIKIMMDAVDQKLIDPNMGHKPDDIATKWFVLAVAINIIKILKGGK